MRERLTKSRGGAIGLVVAGVATAIAGCARPVQNAQPVELAPAQVVLADRALDATLAIAQGAAEATGEVVGGIAQGVEDALTPTAAPADQVTPAVVQSPSTQPVVTILPIKPLSRTELTRAQIAQALARLEQLKNNPQGLRNLSDAERRVLGMTLYLQQQGKLPRGR